MTASLWWAGAFFVGTVCLLLAFVYGIPRWTIEGTRAVPHELLAPSGDFPIVLPAGARIVFYGDSNIAGSRLRERSAAFPTIMAASFTPPVMVANHARGGATAHDGTDQLERAECGDLTIMMFGTNDAAPRGSLSRAAPVSLESYTEAMGTIVSKCSQHGRQVLVLAALPAGATAMDLRIAPYREQARSVATEHGAHFLDPMDVLQADNDRATLDYDALHLNARAHSLIGSWLAEKVIQAEPLP